MSDSYAAARVHAMRSRIITGAQYTRMLGMSPEEIFGVLQSGDYREDINALSIKDLSDLETVDRMLARNNKRLLKKIASISKKDFSEALHSYAQSNDIWNLRIILEALTGRHDPVDAISRYGKYGTFDTAPFETAKNVAAFGRLISEKYVLKEDFENAHDMTLALRKITVRERVCESASATNDVLTDYENIITIVMLKRDGINGKKAREYLRPGGSIRHSVLRRACETEDAQEAIRELGSTAYRAALERATPRGEHDTFIRFEHELRNAALRRIRSIAGTAPLHAEMLIRYLVEKEREHHNLRLIIKAKQLGLNAEFMHTHLMMDETKLKVTT